MTQTKEDRMWLHYKALKKVSGKEGLDPNVKWLTMARRWKMPVREVKKIIRARKGPTMIPVYCCEFFCFVDRYVPRPANEPTRRYFIS